MQIVVVNAGITRYERTCADFTFIFQPRGAQQVSPQLLRSIDKYLDGAGLHSRNDSRVGAEDVV